MRFRTLEATLTPQLCEGRQKYLSLGLDDAPTNQAIAAAKVQLIQADVALGHFDPNLARYQGEPSKVRRGKATGVFTCGRRISSTKPLLCHLRLFQTAFNPSATS